jgi:DNA-binding CsgD family transcriptional regulator
VTRERVKGLTYRRSEREVLDRLVEAVRAGESRALVVRGDPGVGKTVLLDYMAGRERGCRVARAVGAQTEMELAFAGLHQLCAPMVGRAEHLPVPQREALRTAFGLSAGPPPDRFMVGLAVLSLLSEVAGERPLICLIDDGQWLDHASAQALGFVARRLAADPVGLVFAAREPGPELAGLPELEVGGLRESDARTLLDSALTGPIDDRIRDRIVAETQGNPLALLELPRGLTPAELAGGFGLPGAAPLSERIAESFRQQLEALPAQSRRLVLLAAAEPYGDLSLVWRAAGRLGIPVQAAAPAVDAGLVEFGSRVRFRHPLLRSASYRAASVAERQAVHGALAEATDAEAAPERRAWHRAHAAAGPDQEVAAELEHSAGRAQARGGLAAAAAFLERSVLLTADPPHPADLVLAGLAMVVTDGPAAAAPTLRHALRAFSDADMTMAEELRWGWFAQAAASALWDDDTWRAMLARQVRLARQVGALDQLPIMLGALGTAVAWSGDFAAAAALDAEADAVCEVTGSRAAPFTAMMLASLRGRQAEAAPLIEGTIAGATVGGQGIAVAYAHWAAAILANGLGRHADALAAARQASEDTSTLYISMWALPELIEAAARTGDTSITGDALTRLAQFTQAAGTDFGLGVEARCRALLSEGEAAGSLYREAIDRLGRTRLRPELARAHLLYGEWLRREIRRADAREQLRTAHDMLATMGAEAFAERARHELLATGETVRQPTAEPVSAFTAQEAHIARLAADGHTNPEIAAQLFLSARTVEWHLRKIFTHLRKIFTKLGITSRRELREALPASLRQPADVILRPVR